MRQLSSHFSLSASALAASLLVAACGGGGGSAPPSVAGSSGFAVDGYLSGATILCDVNANGDPDAGEDSTTTDTSGFFRFDRACSSGLVATGGTSIDTNLPFGGKLKAPPGATVITPLTTLLSNGMTLDQINTALVLPSGTDVTTLDPARSIGGEYVRVDLFRKTLAIQQILQKTAETLANVAGAGASAVLPTIYTEVASAVAAQLRANPALLSGNAIDAAALTALVNAAVTRVAASPALSAGIRAGLAGVNPASLAEVIAGALKVQTDRILQSTNATLVSTTTTAQSDTRIADFALLNKGALAAAPGGAITALASDITSTVSGGGAPPPPPPPPVTGTSIVSFDETVLPNLGAFGDAGPSIATAPAGGTGAALKLERSGALNFGGTFFTVANPIPFATNRKTVTARVYSTRANAVIYLKVEAAGGVSTEVAATTGAANTWQTLTWVLSGVNPANSYNTVVLSADTDVAGSGAQTYWIDEVTLADAPVSTTCATASEQCISFSESTVAALGFEGLISATVANDPVAGASNKVLSLVKGPSGQPWAGATVYTMGTVNPDPGVRSVLTIDTVGLNTSKIVTVRSYSGAPVGTKITLKLENGIDAGQNIAAETVTTVQNAWETLTFDFSNLSTGVFSSSVIYNTASIFPAFSIPGAIVPLTADTNFYFDELKYAVAVAAPPPPPPPAPPPPAPTTGTILLNFDDLLPSNSFGGEGGEGSGVDATPPAGSGSTGSAYEVLRSGGQPYALAILETPLPLTTTRKTISARVYSPTAGIPMVIKLEGTTGAINTGDVQANEAVVQGWQTLTWTFASGGTATYTKMVLLPNLGTVDAPPGKSYYFDDFKLLDAAGGGGGGGGGGFTGDFAVDYVGDLFTANAKTSSGGDFGFFFDPRLTAAQSYDYAGVAGAAQDPGGVHNFYYGKGLTGMPITDAYLGAFVKAPNNGTVDVSTFTNLKLRVWGPDQLFRAGTFPALTVILQGPPVAGCGSNSGATEISRTFNTITQGAASEYTLPLSSFSMKFSCNGQTIAQVLQSISQFNILLEGTNIQYVNNQPGDAYGNGLNIGPIKFQ